MMIEQRVVKLEKELEAARLELAEAQAIIRAIRAGEADAVVVDTASGPEIYTLRSADEPYRTFVENLREGAVTMTGGGVILYCNEAMARLVGIDATRLIGSNFADIAGSETVASLTRQGASGCECNVRHADGDIRVCHVSAAPHQIDGEVIYCVLVTDLTGQTLRLRHNAIVESTDDAVISFDVDGRITTWNPAAELLFGYSGAEAIGRDADLLVAPLPELPPGESRRGAFDCALAGRKFQSDTRRIAKDGTVIDVSVTASPIRAPDGQILGVSAIMRDIRPRKLAEQRISVIRDALSVDTENGLPTASLEETRSTASPRLDPVERLDILRDVGLLDTPREWAFDQLSRLAAGVLQAPICLVTVVDAKRQFFLSSYGLGEPLRSARETALKGSYCRHVIESEAPVVIRNARENPLVRESEAWREGLVSYLGTPIRNRDGVVIAALSVADMSARSWTTRELLTLQGIGRLLVQQLENREMLRKLRQSEERLSLAARMSGFGVHDYDPQIDRAVWSDELYRIMGVAPAAALNRAMIEATIHPEDRERVAHAMDDALDPSGSGTFDEEFRIRTHDTGEVKWVQMRCQTLFADRPGGRVATRNTGLVVDITERKQREEHERLLMREVNHRAKNMLGLVQAVARQTVAHEPTAFLERFSERIQALAASQDLLVKSGWKHVDIGALVQSQLGHFSDSLTRRITLTGPQLKITPGAAQTIGLVLHELATNAAKYGALSNDTGTVAVTWNIASDCGDQASFSMSWVEKSGPMVSNPERRGFGSTVIEGMVRMSLGGNVEVAYAPAGLKWHLSCPARKITENDPVSSLPAARAESGTEAPVDCKRHRILVVEDEGLIAIEVKSMLENAGFEVLGPATTVSQALSLVDRSICDAAVLDVNLGSETSEPVARKLSSSRTPFVTISGYGPEQQPDVFRSAPFISKPVNAKPLVSALIKCLGERPPKASGQRLSAPA